MLQEGVPRASSNGEEPPPRKEEPTMRTTPRKVRIALLLSSLAMVLGMVVTPAPRLAQASQAVTIGSIAYTATAPSVIGLVSISNPGFEKTIVYQFPPLSPSWTTPFFTDLELEVDGGKGHVVGRNFDTTIVLTNTSSSPGGVDVDLTFYDQDGGVINGPDVNPITVHLAPKGTQVLSASILLLNP